MAQGLSSLIVVFAVHYGSLGNRGVWFERIWISVWVVVKREKNFEMRINFIVNVKQNREPVLVPSSTIYQYMWKSSHSMWKTINRVENSEKTQNLGVFAGKFSKVKIKIFFRLFL